jgi:superfamily II DNA or RNA helicase
MHAQPGFYIAHHRWFDHEFGPGNLHKVGETGDLSRRLHDSGYQTCWPDDFTFVATFETRTKLEAQAIETGVLFAARHWRIGNKELINLTAAELYDLASSVANVLNIKVVAKLKPVYEQQMPVRTKSEPIVKVEAAPPLIDVHSLEHLTVPNKAEQQKRAAELDSFIDDLLAEVPETVPPSEPSAVIGAFKAAATAVTTVAAAMFRMVAGVAGEDATDLDDFIMLEKETNYAALRLETRQYQLDAAKAGNDELERTGRAVLQMACRSGKSLVGHLVYQRYLAADERVLWIVPSLQLLRQTAAKLVAYGGEVRIENVLLIGSDPVSVRVVSADATEATLTMTTDKAEVQRFLKTRPRALIISTYQSTDVIDPDTRIALAVFDEAHRVTGSLAPRPFNAALLGKLGDHRLFLSATPDFTKELSMADTKTFGGIAYKYHLRQAITAGFVNDFKLRLVTAAVEKDILPVGPIAETLLVQQIVQAAGEADKMLVFCKDIGHADKLCQAVSLAMSDRPTVKHYTAHSRMHRGDVGRALQGFSTGGRAIMYSVRMLSEGVEVPTLNAIFYASPRHSPREVIQSLCRPLNKLDGKPVSTVFIPIIVEKGKDIEDPSNLKRFASIIPVFDALASEDPALYDYLLNPANKKYPINILGTKSYDLKTDVERMKLLVAVRKAIRYGGSTAKRPVDRLLRSEMIPWDIGFAGLQRVVLRCKRYPKTVEALQVGDSKLPFYRYYRYLADEYKAGRLEPYQRRALESLPGWAPFGIEGAYHWDYSIKVLEEWLEANGGEPPMLDVHQGGYIGVDATPLERLSGAMTCVNQQTYAKQKPDGSIVTHLDIDPPKAADLDRLHAKYGDRLRWRKELNAEGLVDETKPTWIQNSYTRFKQYVKDKGAKAPWVQAHFPLWPTKHKRQEAPETLKEDLPPKWKAGK